MQVGDLVKNKRYGNYGIVLNTRKTKEGYPAMATVYYPDNGYKMLECLNRLEITHESR